MSDHYSTLGIERGASADEIKRAYRRMASQHHPDKGGDKNQFQAVEEAYRTLSDDQKRAAYDNPNPFNGQQPGGFPGGFHFNFGGGPSGFPFGDVFGMFNQHAQQQRRMTRMSLWVSLRDIATGGRRPVSIATPQGTGVVEIEIPLGIMDGDTVRYENIAPGGGDLAVQFRIHPDAEWERNGLDLIIDRSISVWDLILGADLSIQNITGQTLTLVVPPRTHPRTMLRLRGHGLRNGQGQIGDMLVRVMAHIPDSIHPDLVEAIKKHRV
jgi:DnaJ-class molecular chaperone